MKSNEAPPRGVLAPLRLNSIRSKILALALAATLVPAFSTAVLSYVRTRTALTETLEGELRGIGLQTAREIDLWVKERFYDLRVFVGSFEVTENLDRIAGGGSDSREALTRLDNYLAVVQERFGEYSDLIVLDPGGQAVSTVDGTARPPELPAEWLPELRLGEARLGDPYWNETLATVAATTAVPIESADARFVGVLVATLTFESLGTVLTGRAPGGEGRIDVMGPDGRIVVSTDAVSGYELAVSAAVRSRLEASDGSTEYLVDDAVMVGTLTRVDPIGWSVLAHLPAEDAYAPVARLTRSTFLLVTALMLVVGSVAYFIGVLITRPLDRLTAAAHAVAAGDLAVDVPVTSGDEVGYLTGVFNDMVARLRESADSLREQNQELEKISTTDALTSLPNRRHVISVLEQELNRAGRHDRHLSVLMLDVDKFKQYNDSFGHQAGDEVLAGMGPVLRDATREADLPGRYGGEEFIVVLPECDLSGALEAGERIRKRLAKEVFEGRKVTVSIGAATFPTHADSPAALIGAADVALYAAKEAGRDRVVAAEDAGSPDPT